MHSLYLTDQYTPNQITLMQQPCTDVARVLLRRCGLSFIDQLSS